MGKDFQPKSGAGWNSEGASSREATLTVPNQELVGTVMVASRLLARICTRHSKSDENHKLRGTHTDMHWAC